ncbi:SIR2 family protein [Intestinibaculum porci]|uniref:SIR2 family protein n=1 Tax=Intestinibaculum porci TaxID=2487118 RepID=UPI002408FA2B|nr:SIR2 family protein [Intestinibaculum porci]MDD6348848.1 SIR2 family protein [Intestinibaculum porci]
MQTIDELIEGFTTIPFLFIGSGLSRRYYNLPNWTDLLKDMVFKFKSDEFAFISYVQEAKKYDNPYGRNPKIASLIENDFNELWFRDKKIRRLDDFYLEKVKNGCSPFKAEIAYYLKQKSILNSKYKDEVTLLSNVAKKSIAGIITTNYDLFLEKYLSEFKVYVGQEALLFSQLQGIAEIYKIHGSLNEPQTIIINEEDYEKFKDKSEYLAAKLLTIFMEYPIIFMGYSISDTNIKNILKSIVKCLSSEQLKLLKNRFIFVEYASEINGYEISENSFSFDNADGNLTMTKIKLSDFSLIYSAIAKKEMKIPVRLLRVLKDNLYNYTITNEPTQNLKVADIDDERVANDELVISIGTINKTNLNGLRGITVDQWYRNIVMDDLQYDIRDLLSVAPAIAKQNSGKVPINSLYDDSFKDIDGISKFIIKDFDDIISKTFKRERDKNPQVSLKNIIEQNLNLNKEMSKIAHLREDQIDFEEFEKYLKNIFNENPEILSDKNRQLRTNLRRLIRLYDYLKGKKQMCC